MEKYTTHVGITIAGFSFALSDIVPWISASVALASFVLIVYRIIFENRRERREAELHALNLERERAKLNENPQKTTA